MLRHGSLRFFRLLIGHCREDLKVLVVAVIEHDQKLKDSISGGNEALVAVAIGSQFCRFLYSEPEALSL